MSAEVNMIRDVRGSVHQQLMHVRGFVLTGHERYLRSARAAQAERAALLETLQAGAHEGSLSQHLETVRLLLRQYGTDLEFAVRLRRRQGADAALRHLENSSFFESLEQQLQALTQSSITHSQQTVGRNLVSARHIHAAFVFELFLILFGAVFFTVNIKRLVVRPLKDLIVGAQKIAAGDFAFRVPRSSVEEFVRIGDAFNGMAASLQQAFGRIEDSKKEVEHNLAVLQGAQHELAKSEQRYRDLANLLPVVVYECDLDGQYTFVNASGYEISGYTPGDKRQGMNMRDFMLPEDMVAVEQALGKILAGETLTENEYRFKCKNGEIRWGRFFTSPIQDAGKAVGIRGVVLDITRHKAAEDELRASEERFRALMHQAPEAILVYDAREDHFIDANLRAEMLFGCSREELLTTGPDRFYQPDRPDECSPAESIKKHNEDALAGKEVVFEQQVCNARNQIVHCEVRLVRLPAVDQSLLRASFIDISFRKEAVAALRDDREQLAQIIRTAPAIICGIQADGSVTFLNPACEKATGYSTKEILDRNWWKLFYPGELYVQVEQLFSLFDQGDVTNYEMTMLSKTQQPLTILWSSIVIRNEDGTIRKMYGFGNNITEKKKAEQELQKSRARLAGILAALQDQVLFVDRGHTIVWANDKAKAVFGRDIEGRLCHSVLHNQETVCETCAAARCFQDGKVHEMESDMILPNGEVRRIWHTFSSVERDAEGKVLYVNEVLRDITEWTMLQQEAFRSSRLASIGELAAGVAHEINNPVMGIINYAQIIADQCEKQRRDASIPERIIREGERIGKIVTNLLTFAAPHDTKSEPVALEKIFVDAYGLVQKQFSKNGIQVHSALTRELPLVLAQANKIQQVFINILVNAKDALQQKHSEHSADNILKISAMPVDREGKKYVRIVFHDRGIGIPHLRLEKLCNPFFTTKSAGKGTGLGLSISHSIIKEHGGHLLFESKEGEYTNVIIELPVFKG
ncbi:MAG: PAS domain S-box protein [Deltaproteobacteria bacterium]|nr:PAS domain S-box protein [Deltaproteobacteria bacterium]